jgi:poly(beta-D-mannuronate) lyase
MKKLALSVAVWVAWCSAGYSTCSNIESPIQNEVIPQQRNDRAFRCSDPLPAVRELRGTTFYEGRDAINPKLYEQATRDEAPIRAYTSKLASMANSYLAADQNGKVEIRDCVHRWLTAWARSQALIDDDNFLGGAFRVWALVPIAVSAVTVSDGRRESNEISGWIGNLADRNWRFIAKNNIHNNIAYWAAAGSAFAFIATGRCDLLEKAVDVASKAIDSIDEDGVLPSEIVRGKRAFAYHVFALTPLALTAEVATQNGTNLFERRARGLGRTASLIVRANKDMSFFDRRAGAVQDVRPPLLKGQFVWAEILYKHYRTPELAAILRQNRPLSFDRAGGSQTILFGRRLN